MNMDYLVGIKGVKAALWITVVPRIFVEEEIYSKKIIMKVQLLFVLTVVSWMAVISAKSPGQYFCGRKLADALAFLCPTDMEKRSEANSVDYEYGWPWMPAQRARALGRGKRGGVVSECCEKPCSVEELLSYC